MLARWLRVLLLVALLGGLLAVAHAAAQAATLAAGLVTAIAALVVISAVVTLVTFLAIVAFRAASGKGIGATVGSFVRAFPGEWLALLGLFTVIQPFEAWLMGADARPRGSTGKPHVLLVHGYLCNRGLWWAFRRKLLAAGYSVSTLNLEPPLGSIETFAEALGDRLKEVEADLSGKEPIVVIGHSMGGLVTREMMRRRGAGRIAKVITVGSPHAGTMIAYLGLGRCAREMRPGSPLLRRLAEVPPAVPLVCLVIRTDNFMAPVDTPELPGCRVVTLDQMGHLASAYSPKVHQILLDEIAAA